MNTPLVSIITVNFNNTQVTCELLRSAHQLTYSPIEIIVVDNASKEDPTDIFKAIYPNAIVIRNKTNLGFAGANNIGMKAAQGDYFFLVNNDTELTPSIIQPLLSVLKDNPQAGGVSPKFHFYFHPGIIEYAGYGKMNYLTARNRMIGNKEKDSGQHDSFRETYYMHGGAMMVPRKVVEKAGLMSEEFFLYYEELDWCEQIRRKGYKLYYQPESLIHHKESMTTGKNSPLKTYYITRNRILFIRRNAKPVSKAVFFIYFALITTAKNILTYVIKGHFDHLVAFTKGVWWNLTKGKIHTTSPSLGKVKKEATSNVLINFSK